MGEKRALLCLSNTIFSINEENSAATLLKINFLPSQFWFSFYTVYKDPTFLKGRHPLPPVLNALENSLVLACESC